MGWDGTGMHDLGVHLHTIHCKRNPKRRSSLWQPWFKCRLQPHHSHIRSGKQLPNFTVWERLQVKPVRLSIALYRLSIALGK